MEGVLLDALGGHGQLSSRARRPESRLEDIDARILVLQAHAIEKSTAKHYRTGARDYILFCTKHKLPIDPTPTTIARYIAYTSQHIASASKYLTGARHFLQHIFPDFDKNRQSPFVRATLRGAMKVRADPVSRKDPLRLHHLQLFVDRTSLPNADYDCLLFATLLACAFYACHRMGELVISNDRSLFDWRKVIKRASLRFDDHLRRVQYFLPYHKGDPLYRGTLVMHLDQSIGSPFLLMHKYIALRDKRHGSRPALFIREDGSLPSRSWFEHILFKVVDRSVFGAHSARAGGATFFASLGLSEDVIQGLGRWSSSTWKDYIRDNPAVRAELQLANLARSNQPHF